SFAPPGRFQYWRLLPRVALALLAPPVATNLRPSGAESILATPSTGCARFARSTRGNQPPPLRGGIHVDATFHGLRSLCSLHPWQHSSAPPGRSPYWRRFPRVALAALASPVATNLRPSGADSV